MKPSLMDNQELVRAYEQSLELTRALGRAIRVGRERNYRRVINAVIDNDVWATGGPVCGGIAPGYEGLTHCCYVPEDEVEEIARGGE